MKKGIFFFFFLFLLVTLKPATAQINLPPSQSLGIGTSYAHYNGSINFVEGYLVASDSTHINHKLGFTAETWFLPSVASQSGTLISKSTGTQNEFSLDFESRFDQTSKKYSIQYQFSAADLSLGCAMRTVTYQQQMSQNQFVQWNHVAGVIDGRGNMYLFINGKKATTPLTILGMPCVANNDITIGGRKLNDTTVDNYIKGFMDDLRISSTARYSTDFAPPTGPFIPDANTQILYHFDNIVTDTSGNNHTGIQYGTVFFVLVQVSSITPTPSATLRASPTPSSATRPTPTPGRGGWSLSPFR
ncbi:MAG: LamG-like jellyroll fold domain-containing protein [bacterium]|nr:LamG-like jellyroll fold domain-containing protein [bacterium]